MEPIQYQRNLEQQADESMKVRCPREVATHWCWLAKTTSRRHYAGRETLEGRPVGADSNADNGELGKVLAITHPQVLHDRLPGIPERAEHGPQFP